MGEKGLGLLPLGQGCTMFTCYLYLLFFSLYIQLATSTNTQVSSSGGCINHSELSRIRRECATIISTTLLKMHRQTCAKCGLKRLSHAELSAQYISVYQYGERCSHHTF